MPRALVFATFVRDSVNRHSYCNCECELLAPTVPTNNIRVSVKRRWWYRRGICGSSRDESLDGPVRGTNLEVGDELVDLVEDLEFADGVVRLSVGDDGADEQQRREQNRATTTTDDASDLPDRDRSTKLVLAPRPRLRLKFWLLDQSKSRPLCLQYD